ncbi:MAG: sulfoxide reductase heme-binding subunit YedZ [Nitrospinota bacterium]|nr:sulfoxide reductase heme-binding subunit YedZ [Nitrospinota bacterium]
MKPTGRTALLVALHLSALYPLAHAIWDYHTGGLSANPIEDITRRTGHAAIVLLTASLAATPARRLTGWSFFVRLRRPLGLYSFFYASIHLMIFIGLDFGFDWELIWLESPKKRFIVAGLAAYVILLSLALTSPKYMVGRLGAAWRKLHRMVYPASIFAAAHFVWLVKGDKTRPLIYAAVIGVLLLVRLFPWTARSRGS